MTDKEKLEKVRAEIERVKKNQEGVFTSYTDGKFDLCEHLLSFIDSMQEEPKECMYSKDNYTDKDRKVLCDGCEEECKFNKKEESISEDLEQAVNAYIGYAPEVDESSSTYGKRQAFKAGAQWKEQQLVAKAVKVKISNASIISLPVNCDLKVGDKVLIIKEE